MHNSRLNHRNIDDIEPNNSKMMGEVYSEQRKRSIQENLLRKLGPEFVCQRQGPGGGESQCASFGHVVTIV